MTGTPSGHPGQPTTARLAARLSTPVDGVLATSNSANSSFADPAALTLPENRP
ncbi:hypothetical protein [Streptomyces brasiliscabiei]|uniref:hypothetical protein n=1 Tax=Streptomyces brasiliscabiei TaxID=2736302 RepID=UPI001C101006|nr:hypothetical protein [Streptomyces brasiliscabiei]